MSRSPSIRVNISSNIREQLKLQPGDRLDFSIDSSGSVVAIPCRRLASGSEKQKVKASRVIKRDGSVTIPQNIRNYLKLERGDGANFIIDSFGALVLLPHHFNSAVSGMLHREGMGSVSLDEMNAIIKDRFLDLYD